MKKVALLGAALCLLFTGSASFAGLQSGSFATIASVNDDVKILKVKVTGMTCGGCASKVHSALIKTTGIIEDEVKYPGDVAVIKYDASKTSEAEILKTIEKTGFKAEVVKDDAKPTKS